MIGTNIAIDFGSSSTELYVQGKGVILDEPTMIAVDVETGYADSNRQCGIHYKW